MSWASAGLYLPQVSINQDPDWKAACLGHAVLMGGAGV